MADSTLNDVLKSMPVATNDLPLSLPPVHVTVARWFSSIVRAGRVRPRKCRVFKENLIYIFYGGAFYRTGNKPTRNASELPIAFLFNPTLLSSVCRYYPFDTGAMADGKFGDWAPRLAPFETKFKVTSRDDSLVAAKLVYHLYKNNDQYLRGELNPDCRSKPDPLPLLFDFLSSDLSPLAIDQRQCTIECHLTRPVYLRRYLVWVGFPEALTNVFAKLYEQTIPYVPEYYMYKTHAIFNPLEVEAQLEYQAAQVVQRFASLP